MQVQCSPSEALFVARISDRERFRVDATRLNFDDHAGDVEHGPPFRLAARIDQPDVGEILVEVHADEHGVKIGQRTTVPAGYEVLSELACVVVEEDDR